MSLCPLYRMWNTTDLLCTRHRDMETGQEEEEVAQQNIYITDVIFVSVIQPIFHLISSH